MDKCWQWLLWMFAICPWTMKTGLTKGEWSSFYWKLRMAEEGYIERLPLFLKWCQIFRKPRKEFAHFLASRAVHSTFYHPPTLFQPLLFVPQVSLNSFLYTQKRVEWHCSTRWYSLQVSKTGTAARKNGGEWMELGEIFLLNGLFSTLESDACLRKREGGIGRYSSPTTL